MPQQNVEATGLAFAGIFRQYGIPLVIRSDNGSPFGSTGALGLTRLSAWWVKLGIRVEFIEPGHPEQNGGMNKCIGFTKQRICILPPPLCEDKSAGRGNGVKNITTNVLTRR